jgi:hypothetical protein
VLHDGNPDILHGRSDEIGYALIELDGSAALCDCCATTFPAQHDARLVSQAGFRVQAGVARVQRV